MAYESFMNINSKSPLSKRINNGVIGCVPDHPLMKRLVLGLTSLDRPPQRYFSPWSHTGPLYLTKHIHQYCSSSSTTSCEDVVIHPFTDFLPYHSTETIPSMAGSRERSGKYQSMFLHLWGSTHDIYGGDGSHADAVSVSAQIIKGGDSMLF